MQGFQGSRKDRNLLSGNLSDWLAAWLARRSLIVLLLFQKNGTADGKYEIDTGLNSSDLIGKVYSFNDKKVVDAWYGPYAKMINGTDGQLFAPGLDRRDSRILQLFIGQICRFEFPTLT